MASEEIIAAKGGIASGMVSVFGVATGLHPSLLAFGMLGGWLALSHLAPMGWAARAKTIILSGFVGAVFSLPAAGVVAASEWWPTDLSHDSAAFPLSLLLGFLTYTALAPAAADAARRLIAKVLPK